MRRYLHSNRPLDEVAIERIREFGPAACQMHPEGYAVAFSGGKDSVVLRDLFLRSGCNGTIHYCLTTVDPPELVRFIKTFPDVEILRPPQTMWQLIARKHCPPLRNRRFCCEGLKEWAGDGHIVLTGVRWAESNRRRGRAMIEACYRKGMNRRLLHPIIDWAAEDVWAYIRERGLRYCSLYDEGFTRIGCVMCPMGGKPGMDRDAARWPKIEEAYRRAITRAWRGKASDFPSPEALYAWWRSGQPRTDPHAPTLFDDDGNAASGAKACCADEPT